MSTPEEPIPKRFWDAVGWVIKNHPWIFFLAVVDRLAVRDYQLAAIFGGIFVADLFVAPRWEEIGGYLKGRKPMLPYLALGALGALLMGISVGALWAGGGLWLTSRPNTGRLVWNIDDPIKMKTDFMLVMAGVPNNIRVAGVQLIGKNTSGDPVSQFKGLVRVDHTAKETPFLLMAKEEDATKLRAPFDIPTLPEETYGIPGLADFRIQTFDGVVFMTGVDGVPTEQFLRDSVPFTIILEYDGLKIERHVSKSEIEDELARFETIANPANSALSPHIVRKLTAPPGKFPSDFPPLLQQLPQQAVPPPKKDTP